jgi:hypothetical protein
MMDQFPHLLTQISLVENKRSAALCSRLADSFEDDLLQYEEFPAEHFNFFLALLVSEQYCNKPGVWNFLLAVNNAKDALSKLQYESITIAFVDSYGKYTDKDLCFAVCDFIARNLEPLKAVQLLTKLKQQESHKSIELQGYVDQGFFILEQEAKRATHIAAK